MLLAVPTRRSWRSSPGSFCLGPHRFAAFVLLTVVQAVVLAGPIGAQSPAEPTIADLALDWARGRFASPVICQFDGKPVRGIRRVLITPGPAHVRPAVDRIVFVDLEVDEASRCLADLAGDVPNVIGSVQIRLLGTRRSDTMRRDFREHLRRKQGFEFGIVSGALRIRPVTQPPSEGEVVDFRGGRALLREVSPGSDSARLLSDFDSSRKMVLELSARSGTKLAFPLYMTDLR